MFKKTVYTVFFVSFFAVVSFLPTAFSASNDAATIISTDGSVLVKVPGKRWSIASVGMPVDEESALSTAYDSYCDIALDESLKNIVSIGPETEVTLGKHLKYVQIAQGRVFTLLEGIEPGSSFEVRSPVASGGARGTAWETIVGVVSQFNVAEDKIYVKGFGESGKVTGESDVAQGHSILVDQEGQLGDVIPLSQDDIERLKKWLKRIKDNRNKSLVKDGWKKLIDDYDGESPDLFTELLKMEAGKGKKSTDVPKKGSKIDVPSGADTPDMSITGGDITTQTFSNEATGGSSGSDSGSGDGGQDGGDRYDITP